MKPAAGQNAKFAFQAEGGFRIVRLCEINGDHAHAAGKLFRAAKPQVRNRAKPLKEAGRKLQLVRTERVDPGFFDETERFFKAVNAGQVRCAGFKTVRQVIRQVFAVRGAACAACKKRCERVGEIIPQQQRADAGRAEQPLVPGHAERAQVQRLKIDRDMPGSLRCVERKGDPVFRADGADGGSILHRAAHVGTVRHDAEACVRPDQRQHCGRVKSAFAIAGDAVEFHAGKLQKRAHHGVMLHGTHKAVIPGAQETLEDKVQPRRCAGGEDHMRGLFREGKQPRKAFPQAQRHKPRILCGAIDGTVDRRADGIHIFFHACADPGGLWERGRGVIEIDRLHKPGAPFLSTGRA